MSNNNLHWVSVCVLYTLLTIGSESLTTRHVRSECRTEARPAGRPDLRQCVYPKLSHAILKSEGVGVYTIN